MQAVGMCVLAIILLSETSYYFNICHMGNCFWIISGSISTPRRVRHICFYICLDAKFWSHCSYSLSVFKCSHCGKTQFLPETLVYTWGESNNCSSFHGCPLCNEDTVVVIYLIFQHFLAFYYCPKGIKHHMDVSILT